MSMTDEEWKEAQALAARCIDDPWAIGFGDHPNGIEDKRNFGVAEVYIDDRRLDLPGHLDDELDDARDIEAMRRLFPKLIDQRSARDAMIAAMPDKLRAVYEAAREWRFSSAGRCLHLRPDIAKALTEAIDALEPPA